MSDVRRLSRGLSHDLVTKLEGVGLTPELAQQVVEEASGERARAMVAAVQGGLVLAPVVEPVVFPVWRTVILGRHKDAAAYRQALENGGFKVSRWANNILGRISFATTETPVDLYRVTGREFGLTARYTTDQFFVAVKSRGFTKLPPEVGSALRLGYNDQPKGDVIRVGMEPIADSVGDLDVFSVNRNGADRWLDTFYVNPTDEWDPGYVWVLGRS